MQRAPLTPMNLACCAPDGALAWVLPVDARRLTLAYADWETEDRFAALWSLLDEAATAGEGGGTLWEPPTAVGSPPESETGWVEYQKRRPWLELAALPASRLRLLAPCSASSRQRTGSRLQHEVPGHAVMAGPAARILRAAGLAVELAHFAVLDPRTEEWVAAGRLQPKELPAVRQAYLDFPQRRGGEVRWT
jgi:hypothetical protein